ncbi:NAD(P)-binding domain-containing protein [Microbacterium sp. H1-D42]|uniref:NADPH-dependent F420 reductase n=1 Tax=Microbacterium sp. H1-D42 TaxID=2925844 RepID=UPI001F53D787|nr:NAD(P)-binding domain-containing protein [Microbacterium sp. H1-D42]UNK71162.1 NAD(P)-binding domain-containing protein [Microbacterium sp. H1-D42]
MGDKPVLTKIAVLGVGRVGTAVARTAMQAGLAVNVAASKGAEEIALIAEIITPGAVAMTAADAVADVDLVVLAVPLHKFRTVDPRMLDGKIVIDAMNHWHDVDGPLEDVTGDPRSTSEIVASHLAGARIVKALNHIGYHELEEDARRDIASGAEGRGLESRRALAYATDDADAAAATHELLDRFGFEPVFAGALASGIAFESGTDIFNDSFDAVGMRAALADAGIPALVAA